MSNRYAAQGLALQVSISSVFATIAGVKKLDCPDDETEFFDATGLDDTDKKDGTPTGYGVPGSVSLDLFLDPLDTNHQYLFTSRAAKRIESWKVTYPYSVVVSGSPVSHVWSGAFSGAIKKLKPTGAVSGALETSCEIKANTITTYSTT